MKRLMQATAWMVWIGVWTLLPAVAMAQSVSDPCAGLANGAACNDGNACTSGDTCSQGVCQAGAALSCDDGNTCTDEVCDPAIGCRRSNNSQPCSDDSVCTANDACVPGAVPSAAVVGPMLCWGGYLAPQCNALPIDTVGDAAAQAQGAKPAVASSTIAGFPLIHKPGHLNDGFVGNGSSWISGSANAWAKIDLGKAMPIHAFSFGRDRTGGYDERDPGRFTLSVALTDNVYANGDASGDAAEYTQVYDSAQHGFSGTIAGAQTIHGQFPTVMARYVKIQVTADGAAIDELQVFSTFVAGACVGKAIACDDGDICTADSCHPQAGCQHVVMDADGDGQCDPKDACPAIHAAETCLEAGQCMGPGAALCHDGGSRKVCLGGQWVVESCGTDSCTDTGDGFGGGACAAVDFACQAGVCQATSSAGSDTCGGTAESPTVETWSCQNGNTCVPSTLQQADSCADTGDGFGGGACAATDWSCTDGLLTAAVTGGDDTCGGTAAAPSVSAFACSGGNTCLATVTVQQDACVDSGSGLGGGACFASDWRCEAGRLDIVPGVGIDSCGGTVDAPNATVYACAGGNACLASLVEKTDSCADTGNGAGGGSCQASNWSCSEGQLSAKSTGGVDSCGGQGAAGQSYLTCGASDGEAADTCFHVPDLAAPQVTCAASVVSTCAPFSGAQIQLEASAGDVCDQGLQTSNSFTAGGLSASGAYPAGTTQVTFTSQDASGNVASCVTQVQVQWTPWSFAVYAGEGLELGHDAVVQGELGSLGGLKLKKGGAISGAVFAAGKAQIDKETTVAGGLYTNGKLESKCSVAVQGPVPAAMPGAPVIDEAYYAALLASAKQGGVKGGKWQGLALAGGTLKVHGSFHLASGTLTGPGVVVATGSIRIGHDAQVGAGVTLVAGDKLVIGEDVTVGDQALLYAGQTVEIQHEAVFVGARIVSAGDVEVQHEVSFTGLLAAAGDIHIGHAVQIVGAVMARGEVEIGHAVSIVQDCAAAASLPPGVSAE